MIDFSVLKQRLGTWVDAHWDHGFILHKEDKAAQLAMAAMTEGMSTGWNQKVFFMDENPTAENIARFLLLHVGPKVLSDTAVELCHVRVWETENCYADCALAEEDKESST